MNRGVRAVADMTAGVLSCTALAGAAVMLTRLLAPASSPAYSIDGAKLFGAIAAGSIAVFVAASAIGRASDDLQFAITRRLALVAAALAAYEAAWFGAAVPRLRDVPLTNAAALAVEIGPIALISTAIWGGRWMNAKTRIVLFALVGALCVIDVALINPAIFYGVAEQSGWLQRPSQHVSGVHESPFARHLGYIVLGSLAGLPFVRLRTREIITRRGMPS